LVLHYTQQTLHLREHFFCPSGRRDHGGPADAARIARAARAAIPLCPIKTEVE
jgi:hypothetical protein